MRNKVLRGSIVNLVGFAILACALLIPFSMGLFKNYYIGIITTVLINIIMAVSLNMVTGFLGHLALGHSGFMAVGAYASALVSVNLKITGALGFPLALLFGGLCAALIGVLIGIPALRLRGDYLAIITLAFGEIIRIVIINMPVLGGARGLRGIPRVTTVPFAFIAVAIVVLLMFTFGKSRHGRAILSIREDEVASLSSGIPTTFYKIFAFAIGSFFAGIAGGLYAHYVGSLNPNYFSFSKSIEYLVMVVLGGMGSITGAVSAAIVLTILPEALRGFDNYRMLVYSLALVLMMLFRPEGLLGTAEFSLARIFDKIFIKPQTETGRG
jgi:branched-chain amino acid transport system permease protein